MEAAFFCASDDLTPLLEPDVHPLTQLAQLTERRWDLLVLTRAGCAALAAGAVACGCGTLLLPGDRGAPAALGRIRAERVVGYGLSPRDSLTFSSLSENGAVLCVQRALTRPDGGTVEEQELPLPSLKLPPEDALAVLGMRLLLR